MRNIPPTSKSNASTMRTRGFTLAELAVVLVIVVLLLGGLIVPLSAQMEARNTTGTRATLATVQDALLGFAAANERLPCPASSSSNGLESFCTNSAGLCNVTTTLPTNAGAPWRCSNPRDGFVPAVTLGLSPTDAAGYLTDGWNNRVRYAVVDVSALLAGNTRFVFTAPKGMQQRTLSLLANDANLRICANSGCTQVLTSAAVGVLFSQGRNGSFAATSSDELENVDGDTDFVSHEPTAPGAPGGEFDDIVTWLSPNILYNRMIAAGRLP